MTAAVAADATTRNSDATTRNSVATTRSPGLRTYNPEPITRNQHSDPYGSATSLPMRPAPSPSDWKNSLEVTTDSVKSYLGSNGSHSSLDADEENLVWLRWERETPPHPKAIANEILKGRDARKSRVV